MKNMTTLHITDIQLIPLKTVQEVGIIEPAWDAGGQMRFHVGGGSYVEVHTDEGLIGIGPGFDPGLLPAIQAATFEVVAAKPEHDPLVYERPLPLDQTPFQERNDKYYSIGTAFAIGGGRYVTAAHVLLVGVNSLWGAPALRDNAGHVYRIGDVQKFSLEKDFVVFTLVDPPSPAAIRSGARASR